MSNLVIVAIPDENDRVWKVSSEQVPHLTIMYLGDAEQVAKLDQIVQFVEHAANTTLGRFYLPVDRRGELGEDPTLGPADVLFFKRNRFDFQAVRDFRIQLLKNDAIRTAYDSAQQFDGPWIPHLTLGYKNRPAKEMNGSDDYPFYDVSFNKIAVWPDNYDGPSFDLKDFWDEYETLETMPTESDAIAMGDQAEAYMLEHYGTKGMKWGVRKAETKGSRWDPTGHSLKKDIAISTAASFVPFVGPIVAAPQNVRLWRGTYRGAKALGQKAGENRAAKKTAKEDAKFEKVKDSANTVAAIHNGAVPRMNKDLEGINKRYEDVNLNTDHAKSKMYHDEVEKSMRAAYTESANKLGNKRGTKHLDLEFQEDGSFKIKVREGMQTPTVAKHADLGDDGSVTFNGKLVVNQTGHVVDFEFDDFAKDEPKTPNQMAQADGAEHLVYTGMMDPDDFLEHFGVKGMRWGVRTAKAAGRAVSKGLKAVGRGLEAMGANLAESHWQNSIYSDVKHEAVHNHVAAKLDANVLKLQKSPKYRGKDLKADSGLRKEYYQDVAKVTSSAYRSGVKETYGENYHGTKTAHYVTDARGPRIEVRDKHSGEVSAESPLTSKAEIKKRREAEAAAAASTAAHADMTDAPDLSIDLKLDDNGQIVGVGFVQPKEEVVAHSMELASDFMLEHYGVKGMHWGVRKGPPTAVATSSTVVVPHGSKRKTKIKVDGGENHTAHEDAIKVAEAKAKLKKSGTAALSNKELQEVQNRLNLERNVEQLVGPQTTRARGHKFIKGLIGTNKQANDAANTVLTTQRIYKQTFG